MKQSEWTTNSDLIVAPIQVEMKVDGVPASIDSAKITIRPKTDFSAIQI